MDFKFLRYNTTGAVPYTQGGFITKQENLNGFIATNTGDDPVFVNDRILYPGVIGTSNGDSITIGGNFGEIYTGNIKVSFQGIGAAPQVTIEQKFYYFNDNKILKK
jgi:hypothetical protein